jgi:hypothetical protein
MAKVEGRPTLELKIVLVLSEEEAKALDALFGYDQKEFLNVFYEKMGRAYLEPHEAGLRLLHNTVRDALGVWLERAQTARKLFNA